MVGDLQEAQSVGCSIAAAAAAVDEAVGRYSAEEYAADVVDAAGDVLVPAADGGGAAEANLAAVGLG